MTESVHTILILHGITPGARKTVLDHNYCYPIYQPGNIYAYHHIHAPVSAELQSFPFEGIIIDYTFLAHRSGPAYRSIKEKYSFLSNTTGAKIAISQDEFHSNEILDEWLEDIGVDVIYTPVTKDLNILFPRCHDKVAIKHAFAGYVPTRDLPRLEQFVQPFGDRPISLGSRVRMAPPHYGRAGMLKGATTERFSEAARSAGFAVNVSTLPEDVLTGDDWFMFLGSCKFTFATRAGVSLNDPVGRIREAVETFLAQRPAATFEQIEAACFAGLDHCDFTCVSPRLFEAAAARTGLILLEDNYVPGLIPYRHYIPLKPDYSNLREVFALMRDEPRAEEMIEAAHRHLVKNPAFSYETLVQDVLGEVFARTKSARSASTREYDGLRRHYQRLDAFQRLVLDAPPHWSKVARWAGRRAAMSGTLRDLQTLAEVRKRGFPMASILSAELLGGNINRHLAALAICSLNGLATDTQSLDAFLEVISQEQLERTPSMMQTDWAHCEYIYEPTPS